MALRNTLTTSILAAVFSAGAALAAPLVPVDDNDGIPDINDAINLLTGSAFATNADIPLSLRIADTDDEFFRVVNNEIPLIGLTAGNSNTLGVYSGPGGAPTFLPPPSSGFGFTGAGTALDPFDGRDLDDIGFTTPASGVGFALESSGTTFYSESSRNAGGFDQMIAYSLKSLGTISLYVDLDQDPITAATYVTFLNPVLIAFEDIAGGGDGDFDDTMFLIDAQVVPLPIPALLLLTGLGGLGLISRKKRAA